MAFDYDLAREIHEARPAPILEAAEVYWTTIRDAFYEGMGMVRGDATPDGSILAWDELPGDVQKAVAVQMSRVMTAALRHRHRAG